MYIAQSAHLQRDGKRQKINRIVVWCLAVISGRFPCVPCGEAHAGLSFPGRFSCDALKISPLKADTFMLVIDYYSRISITMLPIGLSIDYRLSIIVCTPRLSTRWSSSTLFESILVRNSLWFPVTINKQCSLNR